MPQPHVTRDSQKEQGTVKEEIKKILGTPVKAASRGLKTHYGKPKRDAEVPPIPFMSLHPHGNTGPNTQEADDAQRPAKNGTKRIPVASASREGPAFMDAVGDE